MTDWTKETSYPKRYRLHVRQRLADAYHHLLKTGSLNRVDLEEIGEVSTPTASLDLTILRKTTKMLVYDVSARCYRLKGSKFDEYVEGSRVQTALKEKPAPAKAKTKPAAKPVTKAKKPAPAPKDKPAAKSATKAKKPQSEAAKAITAGVKKLAKAASEPPKVKREANAPEDKEPWPKTATPQAEAQA